MLAIPAAYKTVHPWELNTCLLQKFKSMQKSHTYIFLAFAKSIQCCSVDKCTYNCLFFEHKHINRRFQKVHTEVAVTCLSSTMKDSSCICFIWDVDCSALICLRHNLSRWITTIHQIIKIPAWAILKSGKQTSNHPSKYNLFKKPKKPCIYFFLKWCNTNKHRKIWIPQNYSLEWHVHFFLM